MTRRAAQDLPPSPASKEHLFTDLRARRKELGLTQVELADLTGVSVRFIHDLENAKPTVQLDRVLAVAETLGLSLCWRLREPGPDKDATG